MILRIPGIGVRSAKKIIQARRFGPLRTDQLKKWVWPIAARSILCFVSTRHL